MKALQFVGVDPSDFRQDLAETIKQVLLSISVNSSEAEKTEFLTREEVASLLKASPVTIYRWTKTGRLNCYGLGNRVYYKRHEVENALIPLKS